MLFINASDTGIQETSVYGVYVLYLYLYLRLKWMQHLSLASCHTPNIVS